MTAPSEPGERSAEGEAAGGPLARAPIAPAAVAELCANIAHDLRSPLGVVAQVLAELRADFASQLTDEHRMLAGLADRGLQRLGSIADALSFVAALESEDFALRCHSVDLAVLLRAAVARAVAIAPRSEVQVACEMPPTACRVTVDEDRLTRAVSEIAINAIRHARGLLRVRLEVDAGEARVAIEDDGEGIAVERQAALFRRFVVRSSRSGLGVGLSIAHDVIVAHHGRLALEVSSLPPGRPGTLGARFVISLPVERAA